MAKLNEDSSRGLKLLIIGMIIALFILFNSPEWLNAGGLYLVLGGVTFLGYLVWDRF